MPDWHQLIGWKIDIVEKPVEVYRATSEQRKTPINGSAETLGLESDLARQLVPQIRHQNGGAPIWTTWRNELINGEGDQRRRRGAAC